MHLSSVSACHHRSHLFRAPLCEKQSTLKRVANIVFHIFTLAIPLLIVSCYRLCHPSTSYRSQVLQNQGVDGLEHSFPQKVEGNLNLPGENELQRSVLADVETLLNASPNIQPFSFRPPGYAYSYFEPFEDTKIPCIARLYEFWRERFCLLIQSPDFYQSNGGRPWDVVENREIADNLMKLSFALCYFAIQDYPRYRKGRNREDGIVLRGMTAKNSSWDRSLKDALGESSSYLFFCLQRVGTLYRYLRGAFVPGDKRWYASPVIADSEAYAARFYTPGTPENGWRELYNEYCGFVAQAQENSPEGTAGNPSGRDGILRLIRDELPGVQEEEKFDYRMESLGITECRPEQYRLELAVR